jgi:hypothetical protein
MNLRLAFLIALVFTGAYFVFFNRKKGQGGSRTSLPDSKDNPYEVLKSLAHSTEYDQLHLEDPGAREILYGVMMDWDFEGKAIITLVAFKTGDASIYFSTGTGIIGAGQYPEVNKTSKEFVAKAESLISQAIKDSAVTTEKGVIKFYLLTNKGKYTVKDKTANVTDQTSSLTALFNEANKLISFIRIADEKTQQQK